LLHCREGAGATQVLPAGCSRGAVAAGVGWVATVAGFHRAPPFSLLDTAGPAGVSAL
jgi:hypothetical protein